LSGIRLAPNDAEAIMVKREGGRRELIDTGRNKMFARRDERGHFREMDDVGPSLAADRRQPAKMKAPRGQGDRGDR
jgi:hypothetical protein